MTVRWYNRYSEDPRNVTDVVFEGVPDPDFNLRQYFLNALCLRNVGLRNVLAPKQLDDVTVSDLESFELANYALTADEIPTLVDIVRKSPHLARLHLERVPIGLKGFRALYPYLHSVFELKLIRCNLGVNTFRWLSQLSNVCSIEICPTPASFFDYDYPNLFALTVTTDKIPQAFLDRHPNLNYLKITDAVFNGTFRAPLGLRTIHFDQCRITDNARWENMEHVEAAFLGQIDVSAPNQLRFILKALRDVKTLAFFTHQSRMDVYADQFYELMKLTNLKTFIWTPRTFCSHLVHSAVRFVSKYHPTCDPMWVPCKSEHPTRILILSRILNEDLCREVAQYLYD